MNVITTPNSHGDGITVVGPNSATRDDPHGRVFKGEYTVIEDRIVDFSGVPIGEKHQDGGIDCVDGANALIQYCVIRNVGKAMLCGNENGTATVTLEDCIIGNCGRRCPEAQGKGTVVTMRRCVVRRWGNPKRWDTRGFGAWAHHGGVIRAEDCVFLPGPFFNGRFWADLIGHIGQAWNDKSRTVKDYLTLGVMRGLTAGPGGKVSAVNCYAPWWVILEGHEGPRMPEAEARALMERLEHLCRAAKN